MSVGSNRSGGDSDLPPEVDAQRWVVTRLCVNHRDYLVGNPHTFPGRMAVWCPAASRELSVSKRDIVDAAQGSKDWIAGFLSGNEPPPPDDEGLRADVWEKAHQEWESRTQRFRRDGQWPDKR